MFISRTLERVRALLYAERGRTLRVRGVIENILSSFEKGKQKEFEKFSVSAPPRKWNFLQKLGHEFLIEIGTRECLRCAQMKFPKIFCKKMRHPTLCIYDAQARVSPLHAKGNLDTHSV
jgi:hypothetical protein